MAKHKLIIALVVVAVSLGGWATLRDGDSPPAPAPGTSGFLATTGDPDAPDATKGLIGDVTSTSHEGLVSEPSPVPGGGVMIDLQGRFRNTATAALADSDSVVVQCLPDTATGGGR
ncbi:MAG: hypothetical protein IH621_14635 [Krumholzibacteria bacterium]|nr:hypothetical protein [Candidatus Krumholzibacteria bacterium]